jgi:hypothetical protein
MWGRTIEEICQELGVTVSFYTARATPPWISLPVVAAPARFFTAEQKMAFDTKRIENIKAWSPDVVIVVDRWSSRGDPFEHAELLRYFELCGSQVILIGQPPELSTGNTSIPLLMAYQYTASENPPKQAILEAHNQEAVGQANQRLRELAESLAFCHFVGVQDLYEADDAHVLVRDGNQVLYIDDDHLSQAGVQKAKERLRQTIETLVKK